MGKTVQAAGPDLPDGSGTRCSGSVRLPARRSSVPSLAVLLGSTCLLVTGCSAPHAQVVPSIEFTRLPPAGQGSAEKLDPIEGRVTGAQPGQRIVLFAQSGVWWVQPFADHPFTTIQSDMAWKSTTHPGNAYAALLVDPDYTPPSTIKNLPRAGGSVRAVALADGHLLDQLAHKTVNFSGYEWDVRQDPGSPGGSRNLFNPANVWVDPQGFLHLRISKKNNQWNSAEVDLPRSLGYGSYRFVVSDVSQLEPGAVLNISSWDGSGPDREMDIEISRWGESSGKNAQYVVQPYYIPANVVRFMAPAGPLTFAYDWEPGRVAFTTTRGSTRAGKNDEVAAHLFTSGIPSPGSESTHLTLYVFANQRNPVQHEVEVIIEKFEYLP